MKYMLLMYSSEAETPKYTPDEFKVLAQEWQAFAQAANTAGVMVTSSGLAPVSSATTVRVRDGKSLVTDGPFAETHEQLGGFFLLDCKDLDEALAWAAKIPTARNGSIEVRPLYTNGQG
jgi:hypothetical protein